MDEFPQDYEVFDLGDVTLQHGATLRDAKLAYKTYGELNADKSNAIVYPTWYSGRHWDNEWLIGDGMALDPAKYFIIVPNMLGNGLSSSPSNTPPPYDAARFPDVTFYDQVEQQHKLVTSFGIETLPLVTGWSMGAGQTYQWAVSYPDMVQRAWPFCGSSKTSEHNIVFLEGVKSALTADAAFKDGSYAEKPAKGLRAAARVYAGWGFSQAFYWQQEYKTMGYSSLEDFLVGFWEGFFLDRRDPNNLLTMLWTWQNGNVGATPGRGFVGDQVAALKTIKAKTIVVPALKDLYFPPEDEEFAVSHIPTPNCASFRASTATSRAAARTLTTPNSSTTSSKSSSRAERDQPCPCRRLHRPRSPPKPPSAYRCTWLGFAESMRSSAACVRSHTVGSYRSQSGIRRYRLPSLSGVGNFKPCGKGRVRRASSCGRDVTRTNQRSDQPCIAPNSSR